MQVNPPDDVKTRDLVLSELDSADPYVNPIIGRIDARGTPPTTVDPWRMPVTETPRAGSVDPSRASSCVLLEASVRDAALWTARS